jgi:hypothetical protein
LGRLGCSTVEGDPKVPNPPLEAGAGRVGAGGCCANGCRADSGIMFACLTSIHKHIAQNSASQSNKTLVQAENTTKPVTSSFNALNNASSGSEIFGNVDDAMNDAKAEEIESYDARISASR